MNGPQTVVVTGASAGLGRAIAERFAREGASVALIARGEKRLAMAKSSVESLGGIALTLSLDVADADAVMRAAERVEDELGPIDVWVNNAMVSVFSPVKSMRPEEYRRVTDVTYLGYVHGTLAALQFMLRRNRGVIVQVGSALAHRSIPLQSAYCAAKHAIAGFHASLRTELLHEMSRVRTVMVQMPAMNTPQFDWVKSRLPYKPQPVPPIFQPEVGAEAVYYAAQHDVGRELNVGWPTIMAVYGNKVAPGLGDRYLAAHGYAAQETHDLADPNAPANLWEPAPGSWGAHGRFDNRSRTWSSEQYLYRRRHWFVTAGLLLAAAAIIRRR